MLGSSEGWFNQKWSYLNSADDGTVFLNLLRHPLVPKVLVCLSRPAFPGVLGLLALRQSLVDQLYPENVQREFQTGRGTTYNTITSSGSSSLTVPLAHLDLYFRDYLWVLAVHWARPHPSLLEDLSLPVGQTRGRHHVTE